MTFGDLETFAIECELDPESGKYNDGAMRFHINGNELGDWDQSSIIDFVAYRLEDLCRDAGMYENAELMALNGADVIHETHCVIYGGPDCSGRDEAHDAALYSSYYRLRIFPDSGDGFDHTFTILLKSGDDARWVWRDNRTGTITDTTVPWSSMTEVLNAFLNWFAANRISTWPSASR
ncbi:MAG TPA: Imm42 family immunity protein [Candidatus Kapabacteria bacterium]|nr:Imm42 family immunity protein [Candidatus Kapabacteria bacterium]